MVEIVGIRTWLLLPLQSHKPDDLESIRKQALKLIGSSVELRITAHKFAFVLPDQAWTAVAIALPNIAARMSRLTRKYLKMIEETDDDHEKEKLYDHLAILLHHSLITYHRFEQGLINWVREKKGLKALQQANEQVLSGLFHLSNSVSETSSAKLRQKDLVQRIRRISQVHLHQRSQQTSK